MFGKTQHIHIIGIGGSGLSGIAEVLLDHDFHVSGSDIQTTSTTEHLKECGASVWNNHEAKNIDGADVVVISPAIPEDNPELKAAKKANIPIIRGAEMLNEISRLRYSIAVSGTHGKTTTTAMTAAVLDKLDPTIVLGGKLVNGSNARRGHGEVMVIEADEAYGSIEMFYPTIAVVTSVDADHLDYYKNIQEIGETFLTFINKVPFYGSSVLCLDQENIQKLIPYVDKKYITYGLDTRADLIAEEIEIKGPTSLYHVRFQGQSCGKIHLKMPGRHNIANSLAAIAVGFELDISFDEMKIALESFQGVHRRFEVLGSVDDIVVVDDYAHNPAKLMAALKGAREGYNRRIIAVFQPHRFGRVQTLEEEFCRSFFQADVLIVTSIYGAGEEPIRNVTGENLARAIKEHGHPQVIYISEMDDVVQQLIDISQPNDLVITLGAGDIVNVGHEFLEQYKDNTKKT
ncbi:UDP-N-acetylmuramate--L-alanine ligase [Candidatus Poribacteria bacterium]|nr:UDP-N-acetylmuramate--L-alanine ligase [Candidatus Poribacteria bacterium]